VQIWRGSGGAPVGGRRRRPREGAALAPQREGGGGQRHDLPAGAAPPPRSWALDGRCSNVDGLSAHARICAACTVSNISHHVAQLSHGVTAFIAHSGAAALGRPVVFKTACISVLLPYVGTHGPLDACVTLSPPRCLPLCQCERQDARCTAGLPHTAGFV